MFELRLLGEPTFGDADSGATVRLWRPHTALMAFLALAPDQTSTRSVLVGLIWPEASEAAARRSLRQVLFRLRRDVGDVVTADGENAQLDTSRVAVDACQFEQLLANGKAADAVALYHGPFLAGFSLPGSLPFSEWADTQRARLSGRAAAACQTLVDSSTAAGDWRTALDWAERWTALAPLSEAAASRLIALHAQLGDRGSALAAYERFSTRLGKELGVKAGPDVEELAVRIRRTTPAPPQRRPPPAALAPHLEALGELPMVGRAEEFARLSRRWDLARGGRPQFVLVAGEPGIGKTRFVTEFLKWARFAGATVLASRAYEVEQGVPYAPLAGALRAAVDAPGLAAVDPALLREAARIVPELPARFGMSGGRTPDDLEGGRLRLLESIRAVLENLAFEAPVVLSIDDLPWADEATLAALHYVRRAVGGARLLVVASARTGDAPPASAAGRFLGTVVREGPESFEQIALSPLGRQEIARLIEVAGTAAGPDVASLSSALERETGGNPLFLLEALRVGADRRQPLSSSDAVRASVSDRLRFLSPGARDLLSAAAVLGRHFPMPTAAAIAQLPAVSGVEAIEELLARRLVQQVEYGYDFLHDLVRQAVYDSLSAERKRVLHGRAFERLAPGPGERPTGLERAGALAMHALLGGLRDAAYHALLDAARLARQVFAGADAARFLEQANQVAGNAGQRLEVWEQLGDLHRAESRFADAALDFRRALEQAERGTPERLQIRIKLLDSALRSGLVTPAELGPEVALVLADAALAGPSLARDAHFMAANACFRGSLLPEAEAHAEAAVQHARAAGEPGPLVRALLLRAQMGILGGTLPSALPLLDEAVRTASAHGLGVERCDADTDRATELSRLGRWAEAVEGWREALRRAEEIGAYGSIAVACVNHADVSIRTGAWEPARSLLRRAEELSQRHDFPHVLVDALVNRTLLAWYTADYAAMEAAAQRAAEAASGLGIRPAERTARALMVLALLQQGKRDEAEGEAAALERVARTRHALWSDDPETLVLARARLALARNDRAQAVTILEAGLAEAKDPFGRSVLRLELAELIAGNDAARARVLGAEALTALESLGAAPLLERARTLAQQLGP